MKVSVSDPALTPLPLRFQALSISPSSPARGIFPLDKPSMGSAHSLVRFPTTFQTKLWVDPFDSKKPVKNADLWRELDKVAAGHSVSWQWLRGHAGCAENERCDRLAAQAVRSVRSARKPDELVTALAVFKDQQAASPSGTGSASCGGERRGQAIGSPELPCNA